MYTGARVGFSLWQYKAEADFQYYLDHYLGLFSPLVSKYIPNQGSFTNSMVSFQLILVGLSFYPVKNIGLFGELSVGSPYWLDIGLNYRFNSQKTQKIIGH